MKTASPQDQVVLLETQLRRGWRWLRFTPVLEQRFQLDYEVQQIRSRLILIVIGILLIATTPIADALLMHPPLEFARITHAMQLGFMTPIALFALLVTAVPRLREYSKSVGILTILVIAAGVIYQRHVGALYDYAVPSELATLVILGAFVLGGIGFWTTLIVALVILVGIAFNEIVTFGRNSASTYVIHASVMHLIIASVAGYLQEYLARGSWLRNGLLQELAIRDPLTGLLNSRAFHQRYRQVCALAAREHRPILVAILDADCFKEFNDTYGHAAGDECLIRMAETIARRAKRASDIKGRIGGEEFVLVCYNITEAESRKLLEVLRESIEQMQIPHERSSVGSKVVTASIGGHCYIPPNEGSATEALLKADQRLYRSKHRGRNCVSLNGDDPLTPEPADAPMLLPPLPHTK